MTKNRDTAAENARLLIERVEALCAVDVTLEALQLQNQRSRELVERQREEIDRLQRNSVRLDDNLLRIEMELKALRQGIQPLLEK